MSGQPILFHDRYRGVTCEEAVYGGASLRLLYGNPPGRLLAAAFISRPFFSALFGWYMRRPASARKIRPFIETYGIDPSEFALPVEAFRSFNEFFHRELHPGARPVDPDPASVVFPADARHLGFQEIGTEEQVFVKGQAWDLNALLGGDEALVERFRGGSLVLSRLCPVDYHHFHFPAGGVLRDTRWLDGPLFSVSPIALRRRLAYLWRNKRCLNLIDAGAGGQVCFIEVGATNVGTIRHRPLQPGDPCAKGQAKGWFEFGGSSVVTLFEPGKVRLSEDLAARSAMGVELYARVGDRMGTWLA